MTAEVAETAMVASVWVVPGNLIANKPEQVLAAPAT